VEGTGWAEAEAEAGILAEAAFMVGHGKSERGREGS
jgi:hypothetical protein